MEFISTNNELPFQKQAVITSKNGVNIDILSTTFNDRIFIIVSQFKKIGTVIEAFTEERSDGGKMYLTNIKIGKRDDEVCCVYARQIIELISETSDKPLLLGIALKPEDRDPETLKLVLSKLFEIKTW